MVQYRRNQDDNTICTTDRCPAFCSVGARTATLFSLAAESIAVWWWRWVT